LSLEPFAGRSLGGAPARLGFSPYSVFPGYSMDGKSSQKIFSVPTSIVSEAATRKFVKEEFL
jgi:hypothetical protein